MGGGQVMTSEGDEDIVGAMMSEENGMRMMWQECHRRRRSHRGRSGIDAMRSVLP